MAGWYLEDFSMGGVQNCIGGCAGTRSSEGYFTLQSPTIGGREEVPWLCVDDDFGDLVHGILLNPMRWNRRTVQAVSDIASFGDVVTIYADVTKKKSRFITSPISSNPEGQHGSDDIFAFYQMRNGEVFGNGITENRTAAELKRAAFKAKGGRGSATLMTCREWFERIFIRPGSL